MSIFCKAQKRLWQAHDANEAKCRFEAEQQSIQAQAAMEQKTSIVQIRKVTVRSNGLPVNSHSIILQDCYGPSGNSQAFLTKCSWQIPVCID